MQRTNRRLSKRARIKLVLWLTFLWHKDFLQDIGILACKSGSKSHCNQRFFLDAAVNCLDCLQFWHSPCQAEASLLLGAFSMSVAEPIQVALVLRHLLSQPCASPLCYPPDLSWSVLLPCLSSSLLVSLLSSGHWPHLKATSGLSSSLDTTLRLPLPENHPFFLPLNFSEEPWAPRTNLTRQEFCPVLVTPLCIGLSAARKAPLLRYSSVQKFRLADTLSWELPFIFLCAEGLKHGPHSQEWLTSLQTMIFYELLNESVLNPCRKSINLGEKSLLAHKGPLKVTWLFSNWKVKHVNMDCAISWIHFSSMIVLQ